MNTDNKIHFSLPEMNCLFLCVINWLTDILSFLYKLSLATTKYHSYRVKSGSCYLVTLHKIFYFDAVQRVLCLVYVLGNGRGMFWPVMRNVMAANSKEVRVVLKACFEAIGWGTSRATEY